MSGFAVGFGSPSNIDIGRMMQKMSHRGPYASSTREVGKCMMSQNYLKVDIAGPVDDVRIPVQDTEDDSLAICYDGQMGNWETLAHEHNIADGPCRDERLLLALYRRYGEAMLDYLGDTIFSFVICDGNKLFAARDVLGIKTLFYGRKDGCLYLASELKGLRAITADVNEFPNGRFMTETGDFKTYSELTCEGWRTADEVSVDEAIEHVREIIDRSFDNRVGMTERTGSLLSGGLDSSVICAIAARRFREKFGADAKLKTFAIGVGGESGDTKNARVMAEHAGTDHHELIVGLDDVLDCLPEIIYHLESFDPSLVRSAAANFLISQYANDHGVEELLSGEGGDEIFCGYSYLKEYPATDLVAQQLECLGFLHSNASLRLDRMNQCHSVRVVAPLISGELLDYAMGLPPEYKMGEEKGDKVEKWIFRKAFAPDLPDVIAWRLKQEFSQGSGSAGLLPGHFEDVFTDGELSDAQSRYPMVRSKEELYYFRLFTDFFGDEKAVETVGQWVSL